jgi:hypothetical protein
MFESQEDLVIVGKAIQDLVQGTRKVRVEYTDVNGRRTAQQFTEVNLNQLLSLQAQMKNDLNPTPMMQSVDVEIEF